MTELSEHTSLRVGGAARNFVEVSSESEIIAALKSAGNEPVLILGGGTNLLVSDEGFAGTVIHITNSNIASEVDACSGATLTIGAGQNWDELVAITVERGFAGLETLSGIPGTVGAAPIQNIGAYGHEVSEFITQVRTFDRQTQQIKTFTNSECQFSYRNSFFKQAQGRYIVISVSFQLRVGEETTPIKYEELATHLGVKVGDKVSLAAARKAVLEIRARKGMLLNPSDVDSWSAGSFFTNPIVSADIAAKLPDGAPRWPQSDGRVKVSAAWLMEHAGVEKGLTSNGAGISTKHVLAITNRGTATAADLIALAQIARDKVHDAYGITLEPEVNLVGLNLR
jgi:UDP-N-acetylmuramate dehydrogenase